MTLRRPDIRLPVKKMKTLKIMIMMMVIVTDLILTDRRQARVNGWAVNLEKKRRKKGFRC